MKRPISPLVGYRAAANAIRRLVTIQQALDRSANGVTILWSSLADERDEALAAAVAAVRAATVIDHDAIRPTRGKRAGLVMPERPPDWRGRITEAAVPA